VFKEHSSKKALDLKFEIQIWLNMWEKLAYPVQKTILLLETYYHHIQTISKYENELTHIIYYLYE
jgi:hypothetical protein